MNRRFFSETPIQGDSATLADSEAHHLLHVLRAKVGDQVTLFDGSGSEFLAEVTATSRRDVTFQIVSSQSISRETTRPITLAVALPKGDRQKMLVEKCVELGVAKLIPIHSERGVAQPKASALDKLRRAVVEASKQCGRNRLMQIGPPQACGDLIENGPRKLPDDGEETKQYFRLFAHPYDSVPFTEIANSLDQAQSILAAIGPEGGFSDEEFEKAVASGWQAVGLGPRILRIETAAIALAARLAN